MVIILLLAFHLSTIAVSFQFDLKSGDGNCIREDIRAGFVTVGNYSIVNPDGDHHSLPDSYRITLGVYSANGHRYHHAEDVQSGQFVFTSPETGEYLACFRAQLHDPETTLSIEFDWKSGMVTKAWNQVAKKGSVEAMELELKKLLDVISSIRDEMFYLRKREYEMLNLNTVTNLRMGWLSLLSFFICSSVAGLQFWHLKLFFQKKKLI